jgi:hypothetical protein
MEGTFNKSNRIKRALFGIMTEEEELKIEERGSEKASAMHYCSVITFSPILSWVTT